MLARILKVGVKLAARVLLDPAGDADATGLRNAFQARRHIHAVAIDIAVIDDDVANIDADAKLDPLLRPDPGVALGHAALDVGSTVHRINNARELHQHAVAGGLHDPSPMFVDFRIDEIPPMRL